MDPHVVLQVARLCENGVTLRAGEGLVPGVNSQMRLHAAGLGKSGATVPARKWLFPRMFPPVLF